MNYKTYEVKVYENDTKHWFLNGKKHREDGPAIEQANGYKVWYLNNKPHREDGPAVEYADGDKHWYLNGKRHRGDGPAIERTNGTKYWFLNDKEYSEKDYWKEVNKSKEKMIIINGKKYSESIIQNALKEYVK